jgi:2-C-methyl-D-erythritol 4-phosphate cytidylyltransferase
MAAQTPQAFCFPEILEAHIKADLKVQNQEDNFIEKTEYTDDAQIWDEFCGPVMFIAGDPENRKITFPGDLQ